jgi:hypothetical protein
LQALDDPWYDTIAFRTPSAPGEISGDCTFTTGLGPNGRPPFAEAAEGGG